MCLYEFQANRQVASDFVRLDAQSWLMSTAITSALLVAFAIAWSLQGTIYGHLTPYADPVVLALLTLVLVFVPIRTVRKALREILLITPPELDAHVRTVMTAVVARHGFKTYTSYVAKVGRAQFIEVHIAVPAGMRLDNVATVDAIRGEIAEAIGDEGRHRWLTIDFTADPRWL
jgi:predicted Co/Zn/Cd cation transporter (cation efflux family)